MTTISVQSPAKVNLALDVTGLREDGFHDIHTVFYQLDLADEIDIETTPAGGVHLEVSEGDAPTGEENLVVRAARWVLDASWAEVGLKVTLRKRLPMQAGLGGGSSNAAVALRAAAQLLGYQGDLSAAAAALGSDVPFFLTGGVASAKGRGEIIEPLDTSHVLHLLVVKPDVGVPTAWAYEELDKTGLAGTEKFAERMSGALVNGDRDAVLGSMGNDFELVVFQKFPEIGRLKNRLERAGAEVALLCGSGSAVFGVFRTREDAEQAAEQFPDVWRRAASGVTKRGDV